MDAADRTLWDSWRARRDGGAFETLVRPHLGFAMDLARRTGLSSADAEDVVQDALVRLAREDGERPVDVGFRAWLGRVVSLRSRMKRREEGRRRRRESLPRPAPGDDVPAERLDAAVERALAELPEPQREAVVLHYLHDLDYAEVAHVLGVSENACRIRVHRGIERLRARLGERAPAALAALPLCSPPANPEALVASALANAASPGFVLATLGGALVMNKTILICTGVAIAVAATIVVANRLDAPEDSRRDAIEAEQAAAETGGARLRAPDAAPPPAQPPAAAPAAPAPASAAETDAVRQSALIAAIYAGRGRVGVGTPGAGARSVEWLESAPTGLGGRSVLAVIAGSGASAAWLGDLGLFPDLVSLRLSRHPDLDLTKLPILPQLEEIDLDRVPVTRDTILLLERQPRLSALTFSNTRLDDEAMRALSGVTRLTSLSLRDAKFAESAIPMLASLTRVRTLRLDGAEVTDAGLAPLAGMPALEHVDLSGAHISGAGLEALASLPALKRVTLEKSRVTDEGVRAIAALRVIETVDFEETGLTDAGVAALAGTRLVDVNLAKTRITDAAFETLARISTLRKVDVGDTKVTKDGIARFKALRPDVRVRD